MTPGGGACPHTDPEYKVALLAHEQVLRTIQDAKNDLKEPNMYYVVEATVYQKTSQVVRYHCAYCGHTMEAMSMVREMYKDQRYPDEGVLVRNSYDGHFRTPADALRYVLINKRVNIHSTPPEYYYPED